MYLALMMGAVAATHCPPVIGAGLPKAGTRSLAHYMHLALNYKTYKSAGGLVFETSPPGGLVFERDFLLLVHGQGSHRFALQRQAFYDDYPWYAAPCAFARTFPNVSFVLMKRECHAWAESAIHQLFCQWLAGGCAGDGFNASSRFGYAVTYHHFERLEAGLIDDACRSKRDVCGGDARLVPRFMAACEAHSRLVRACVPSSRLFTARLEPTFNSTGLDALGSFLDCPYEYSPTDSWGVYGKRGVT